MADTWDGTYEADPEDTDLADLYASIVRNLKSNVRERMERDHEWASSGSDGGKHKHVTFIKQGGDATTQALEIALYTKDDGSANTELYMRQPSNGAVTQLTTLGNLKAAIVGIGGLSASDAEQIGVFDPGETGAQVHPASLSDEIRSLRNEIEELKHGHALRTSGGANKAAWLDQGVTGPNHQPNPAFLDNSITPIGYTISSLTATLETIDPAEGVGRQLKLVASGAGQTIRNTLKGLKASSRYLVMVRCRPVTGIWNLTTTGAAGASFGNLALATSGSGWQTLKGIIETDGTPTDVVWILGSTANLDDVRVARVTVRELSVDRGDRQVDAFPQVKISNASTNANLQTDTTVHVVPPGDGYAVILTGFVKHGGNTITLQEDLNLAGTFGTVVETGESLGITIQVPIVAIRQLVGRTIYSYRLSCSASPAAAASGNAHFLSALLVRM